MSLYDLKEGAEPKEVMRELVRGFQLHDDLGDALGDLDHAAKLLGVPTLYDDEGDVREEYRFPDEDDDE